MGSLVGGSILSKILSAPSDLAFGRVGTTLSNMVPSSDANARPLYRGEKHAFLKLQNGRPGRGNYIGPGTQLIKRLQRGDPGRTPTDMVAKRHDIDYGLAKTPADVRAADNRMIRSLKRIEKNGLDSKLNTQQGMRLIQAKTKLEDVGLFPAASFAGTLPMPATNAERRLMSTAQAELEQQGYGKKKRVAKKLRPGLKLRRKLLAQTSKTRKKRGTTDDEMAAAVRGLMVQLNQ